MGLNAYFPAVVVAMEARAWYANFTSSFPGRSCGACCEHNPKVLYGVHGEQCKFRHITCCGSAHLAD